MEGLMGDMTSYKFNDSACSSDHYIQEGPDIKDFLKTMGTTIGRSACSGFHYSSNGHMDKPAILHPHTMSKRMPPFTITHLPMLTSPCPTSP